MKLYISWEHSYICDLCRDILVVGNDIHLAGSLVDIKQFKTHIFGGSIVLYTTHFLKRFSGNFDSRSLTRMTESVAVETHLHIR